MSLDPRPLYERFDLTYVRERSWPYGLFRSISFVAVIGVSIYLTAVWWTGDRRAYSSGEISEPHALIAEHCERCHQPNLDRPGYWLPASDSACLRCHIAPAHPDPHGLMFASSDPLPAASRLAPVQMAANCVACHVEHRGRDYDLKRVPDTFCVQCHRDLQVYTARVSNAVGEVAP
jgi:predicted CXXCH cytochrome family protein